MFVKRTFYVTLTPIDLFAMHEKSDVFIFQVIQHRVKCNELVVFL